MATRGFAATAFATFGDGRPFTASPRSLHTPSNSPPLPPVPFAGFGTSFYAGHERPLTEGTRSEAHSDRVFSESTTSPTSLRDSSRFESPASVSKGQCHASSSTIDGLKFSGPLINIFSKFRKSKTIPISPSRRTETRYGNASAKVFVLPESSFRKEGSALDFDLENTKTPVIDLGEHGLDGDESMSMFTPILLEPHVIVYNSHGDFMIDRILNQLGSVTKSASRVVETGYRPMLTTVMSVMDEANILDKVIRSSKPVNHKLFQENTDIMRRDAPVLGHLAIVLDHSSMILANNADLALDHLLDDEAGVDRDLLQRNKNRHILKTSFQSIKVYMSPDSTRHTSAETFEVKTDTQMFLPQKDFDEPFSEYFDAFWDDLQHVVVSPGSIPVEPIFVPQPVPRLHVESTSPRLHIKSSHGERPLLSLDSLLKSEAEAGYVDDDVFIEHQYGTLPDKEIPVCERGRRSYRRAPSQCIKLSTFSRRLAMKRSSRVLLHQYRNINPCKSNHSSCQI